MNLIFPLQAKKKRDSGEDGGGKGDRKYSYTRTEVPSIDPARSYFHKILSKRKSTEH